MHAQVLELHWLPSGEQVVSASADRTVRGWDVHTGTQVGGLANYSWWIGTLFIRSSVWDMHTGTQVGRWVGWHTIHTKLGVFLCGVGCAHRLTGRWFGIL